MDVSKQWEDLARELTTDPPARIYVAGETDSGKTTLCRFLIDRFSEHAGAASYLDCDPGQSTIGPPSTIGLDRTDGARLLRFAGATSPHGYLLQNMRAIVDLASRAGRKHPLVIDSSGYVTGETAREFQYSVIDILRPDVIVIPGSSAALESVCRSFGRSVSVRRVAASGAVRPRSTETRRAYRETRFGEYFRSTKEIDIDRSMVGLTGRVPHGSSDRMPHRLVGLLDEDQLLLSLGIVIDAGAGGGRIRVLARPIDPSRVCSLQFGHMRVDRSGRELDVE